MRMLPLVALAIAVAAPASAQDAPNNLKPGAGARGPIAAFPSSPGPLPGLVFTPVKPCRLFDTRTTTKVSTAREFLVSGSGDFTGQGGSVAAGCGVPASANAVALAITTLGSTGSGTLRANAPGSTVSISAVSFNPSYAQTSGTTINIANNKVVLKASSGSTDVIGEISGYYAPQLWAYINPDGTIYSSTERVVSSTKLSTGSYQITFDRTVFPCSVHVNIDGGYYYGSSYPSGTSVYVQTWALSNGTATATDLYHNVFVSC